MSDSVRDVLLARRGIALVEAGDAVATDDVVRAVELELAELGYVVSRALRARMAACSPTTLADFRLGTIEVLAKHVGGNEKHEPLFRRFPEGIPTDTRALWWNKVLVHFLQATDQPCLFCGREGTTHVLNPCMHVVCDHCFDGSTYSACPVCEHHVDRSSPFFQPVPQRSLPVENVRFKLLHLGTDEETEARKLLVSLCERKQALSPDDRDALVVVVRQYKAAVTDWLPATIPVRENVALVFGTLFREIEPSRALSAARRYLKTATDVLRFIAVLSGADASLQGETVFKEVDRVRAPKAFWSQIAKLLGAPAPGFVRRKTVVPIRVRRFKTAKLSRALRRSILELLDGLEETRLTEDMLRHRSYWVWVGEFLHPGEYPTRFPRAHRAFQQVRKNLPDGTPVPPFRGWNSRLEKTFADGEVDAMLELLVERPGEFARRFDWAIRRIGGDLAAVERVARTFVENVPKFASPVLLLLRSYLPTRTRRADVRVYWPKGRIAKGVAATDDRAVLPREAIEPAVRAVNFELLRRFAEKSPTADCIIDEALRSIPVPFNERTAVRSAVQLPRGSQIPIPLGKTMRLFLHWCQPEENGHTTDLDLSVALYDERWQFVGTCSYYQLQLNSARGELVAQSAGDLRDAPWPDGATEFVDLHLEAARSLAARYAVMVVNNYQGMPFSRLERGFAGIMLRDDVGGRHFDPRSVELKFALDGENGVFMPAVVDLIAGTLHWLDVQAKGQFEMNNVETSKSSISKICPDLITYFAGGLRPNMYDLALLHAAARSQRVFVRGECIRCYERRASEDHAAFHQRLLHETAPETDLPEIERLRSPLLAVLFQGDLELPPQTDCYALFRERVQPTLSAADLL